MEQMVGVNAKKREEKLKVIDNNPAAAAAQSDLNININDSLDSFL